MDAWLDRAKREPMSFVDSLPDRATSPRVAVLHTNDGGPNLKPYWEDRYKATGDRIAAHFQVLKDGTLIQYVPLNKVAFAAYASNDFAVQIETEDDGHPDQNWTRLQCDAIGWLLDELGIPPRMCPDDHSSGVGYHEQFPSWNQSHHSCPGHVREAQLRDHVVPGLRGEPHAGTDVRELPSWYHRLLKLRDPMMVGGDVTHVQEIVGASVDGTYGPNTARHVRAWQHDHGVNADGVVGYVTAHHMWRVNHPDANR